MRQFSAGERFAASQMAQADLYFFARWMFLQRRGFRWQRAQHHAMICHALERVFRGECRRLIINVPPRYSKTELAVVNFVAWAMGQVPDAEFIHASYSGTLAVENSAAVRAVMQHEAYREVFPAAQLASDAKGHWKTTAGGVMYAAGAGGTITGFGAGKHRDGFGGCFPHEQLVETESGPRQIGEIVQSEAPLRVWSFNERTGKRELRRVVRFWRNPANHVIEVASADGRAFRCTPDHEVLTRAGWVSAIHLAKALDLVDGEPGNLGSLLAGQAAVDGDFNDAFRVLWLCVPLGIRERLRNACPCLSELDLPDNANADSVLGSELCRAFIALENGRHAFARQLCSGAAFQNRERAVTQRVLHVVGLCAIREIGQRVVQGVAVEVPDLVACGSWAYELLRDQMRDVVRGDDAVYGQVDPEVSLSVARRLKHSDGTCPPDLASVRNLIQTGGAGDWQPDTVRYVGHVDETFCLEVEGNHNFILSQSGAIVSNCIIIDDPHKPDEARSDVIRQGVIDWFQNTLESRKNSPTTTPIVLIMQRLHEKDLAGWLLGGGNGEQWEHVCLPALRDDGTALWPEKHDVEALRRMRVAAPYTFAGQYQQSPAPPEGNIFRPDAIEVVDAVPVGTRFVRGWDLAASHEDGDWTAGGKLGVTPSGRWIIADMVRLQGRPEAVQAALKNTAGRDGTATRVRLPQDPGQAGKAQVAALTKLLAGYSVTAKPVSGDKVLRAEPFAAQVNVGNVMMLRAEWNDALISELRMFPNGAHDDQVDALSDAFSELNVNTFGLLELMAAQAAQRERAMIERKQEEAHGA